jgi:hypothetical protein
MRVREVVLCTCVALAFSVLFCVFLQATYAVYPEPEYDCATYDGFTWFIRAQVEGHYSQNPLYFRYAWHEGYRTAVWPFSWYTGNLRVTIIGHAGPRGESYEIDYNYSGEGGEWILGPAGLYGGCDTQSYSRFANAFGEWYKYVYASVLAGPV